MIKSTFKVKTWGLTKNGAISRANEVAHRNFKAFITKDKGCLQSAELGIRHIKRNLFLFDIEYVMSAIKRPQMCVVTVKSKITKEQIKKTPKKLYKKRDKKGRFSK